MRAAGLPVSSTVPDPLTIVAGGPTHTAMSPTTAAGIMHISTVGAPGPTMGPPTCGTGPVVAGQACISVSRAAAGIFDVSSCFIIVFYYYHCEPALDIETLPHTFI